MADKFLQAADAGDTGAGVTAFCGHGGGRADGEAAEPVQPAQNQPADWLRRVFGGADGGQGCRTKVGLESDAQNFLLMHAIWARTWRGVIGSAIAAGVMLSKYVLAM